MSAMAPRDGLEHGPRAALHLSEVAEVAVRARTIIAARRRRFGGGDRQARLQQLADEYAITLRTLYRYLHYGPPVAVRVGTWSATFAVKEEGTGAPVQLTGWIHDDEAGP